MSDPIADMLTRIRNALQVRKSEVSFSTSKTKISILDVLVSEGFIESYSEGEQNGLPTTSVKLKYYQGKPVIEEIHRVSKPGCRIYNKFDEIKPVRNGFGIAVISTSKGIMTDKQARNAKVGGEVICSVY